jgi:hypothetical protein
VNLKQGDVLRMTHWNHHDPEAQFSFKAAKNSVGVFLLLGHEARDGSAPLDLEQAMKAMGWRRREAAK